MRKADVLSRMTGLETGEKDNENVVLLKPEIFISLLDIDSTETILSDIRKRRKNLERVAQNALEKKFPDWNEDNGIITWQGRIYVPRDNKLRSQIITMHHDTKLTGHPGRYKTLELITRNYWWPGISRDVRQYVEGCESN